MLSLDWSNLARIQEIVVQFALYREQHNFTFHLVV
jgi:hypothetical protein